MAKCGLPPELSGCQQHPLASHVGCVDPTIPQSILLPAATDAQVGSVAVATDRVATNRAEVRIGHKEGLSEINFESLAQPPNSRYFRGQFPKTREKKEEEEIELRSANMKSSVVCLTLLASTVVQSTDLRIVEPERVENGELIPATPDTEPASIDATNAPRPDITAFLKKCRKKCDNDSNLPSYMENHQTSAEHCYLGCHWGYEMLCEEIGCVTGVVHKIPTPAKKKIVKKQKPKRQAGSSATGGATGSATGGGSKDATGGVNAITGGMSNDAAEHLRSVDGVNNGWPSASEATGSSGTGGTGAAATGSATGANDEEKSGTGGATGASTGGAEVATKEEIKAATERRRLR